MKDRNKLKNWEEDEVDLVLVVPEYKGDLRTGKQISVRISKACFKGKIKEDLNESAMAKVLIKMLDGMVATIYEKEIKG